MASMEGQGWYDVRRHHPPHGKTCRVYCAATHCIFDATPCYGLHEPWWIPRNGYTHEESSPIPFTSTYWQEIIWPETHDEGTRIKR